MITLAVINEELAMSALWDYVIVLEDPYKSGRDCPHCDGKGHQNQECEECHGRGTFRGKVMNATFDPCTTCTVGEGPLRKTLKFMPCLVCKGTGTSSIVTPEDTHTRPTTGIVQSVGPLCSYTKMGGELVRIPEEARIKTGDRVLYHTFVGSIFELGTTSKIKIRYIKESEILGRLHGVVKKTPLQGEHTELMETGI